MKRFVAFLSLLNIENDLLALYFVVQRLFALQTLEPADTAHLSNHISAGDRSNLADCDYIKYPDGAVSEAVYQ